MTLRPYRGLRLIIYRDPSTRTLVYEEIAEYLQSLIPLCTIELREEFLTHALREWGAKPRVLARSIASSRVVDILSGEPVGEPLPGEIFFEERALARPDKRVGGILYEGYTFQNILRRLIPSSEMRYGILHTVLTQRLLVTKEWGEGRAHARTIILCNPTLISTTGLVEAPALPPEIYMRLQLLSSPDMQQIVIEEEKQRHRDRVLTLGDERLTEVLKGYTLMGVFYHLFGEAFCGNPRCRLYNAHTHEELIEAQTKGAELCATHRDKLNTLQGTLSMR
ncbi:MAG: hypothetical protein RMJ28_04595 [Nitrososphaerota archaeon]|nr:hypothetical protein [Candidatus Calditenuaceae archaeon]MDW8073498.1 hypothetical protein [Nitrososphaerota archaeon]